MKTKSLLIAGLSALSFGAVAQVTFDNEIDFTVESTDLIPEEILLPESPLQTQVLFIGGHDMVQTLDTYGNPATEVPAKQWNDFIGFTPDNESDDLGWISINHEMIASDDNIGDGGGMTVFKVKRNDATGELVVLDQTIGDGRTGKYFNVDFVNTVGETGMNCGGIMSTVDGRIWTAEEWFRADNKSIFDDGDGVRDTLDFTIDAPEFPSFDGQTIKKYQNFNWMVEIDPREATAVRKQYNWGRQPFEGGVVMPDNKTVYTGADDTPAFLSKFVADNQGDFTVGTTYVYKHDASPRWVEIDNTDVNKMLNFADEAVAVGATMFNRLEWVAYNPADGNVYLTETGRDNPGSRWEGEAEDGAVIAPHHIDRATAQGTTYLASDYSDYYGRVLKMDVSDAAIGEESISVHIEGGPHFEDGVIVRDYPNKHLSNPDGLNFLQVGDDSYMVICEDLNGTSKGRMPEGISNRLCEVFLLDMSIPNPSIDDLIRIAAVPLGAEVTGACVTPDGKTLLINSQHPSSLNDFPYNNSLTIAISGWDQLAGVGLAEQLVSTNGFSVYPNPVSRELSLSVISDIAIYNAEGKRVKVARNTKTVDVSDLTSGIYFVKNAEGQTRKLVVR